MPRAGYAWWHVILSTKGSWLPGDPRGFRDHGHRLHSSGDYKRPPPAGEHASLYHWNRTRGQPAVLIPDALQPAIGEAILEKAQREAVRVVRLAVSTTHAHLLMPWHGDYASLIKFVGKLKQCSSQRVRVSMPGAVWAKGGKPVAVRDESHHKQVLRYIREHRDRERAWYWSE